MALKRKSSESPTGPAAKTRVTLSTENDLGTPSAIPGIETVVQSPTHEPEIAWQQEVAAPKIPSGAIESPQQEDLAPIEPASASNEWSGSDISKVYGQPTSMGDDRKHETTTPISSFPVTNKPLASEYSDYIYHVFAEVTRYTGRYDEDGVSEEDFLGTFSNPEEANECAQEWAEENGYYDKEEARKTDGRPQKATREDGTSEDDSSEEEWEWEYDQGFRNNDGLFFYNIDEEDYDDSKRGTIEVRRQKIEQAPPDHAKGNTVWAVVEEGKNVGIYASDIGAVKAVEKGLAARAAAAGEAPGVDYMIERNGLVGVKVEGGIRTEILKVERWNLRS